MACIIEKTRPWQSNRIAYEIDLKSFEQKDDPNNASNLQVVQRKIRDGINEINNRTNLEIIPRKGEDEYLLFINGEGCRTKVGYQRVNNLVPYAHEITCDILASGVSANSVTHEICHAIGLWHEQSRQDRDDYISVRFDGIQYRKKHNYYKKLKDGIDLGQYDYSSIMHYRRRSDSFTTDWGINKQIPSQTSKASPSIFESNNFLHLVHLGNSSDNIYHSWFDGENWTDNVAIPNQSSKSPPSISNLNKELHMVYLESSGLLEQIYHTTFNGFEWSRPKLIPNQKSKQTPSITEFNGVLHMVYIDDLSKQIYHTTFEDSKWSTPIIIPNQTSKQTPSITEFDGELHMVHLGESSNNIYHSWFNPATNTWSDEVLIPDQKSKVTPSIFAYSDQDFESFLIDKNGRRNPIPSSTTYVTTRVKRETAAGLFDEPEVLTQENNFQRYGLHMVHLENSSNDIWSSFATSFDSANKVWNWSKNKRSNQKSQSRPQIATYGVDLFLLHLGNKSNNIWYSVFNDDLDVIWTPTRPANANQIPNHPDFNVGKPLNIGQRVGLSLRDIKAINYLYPLTP